MSSSKDAYEFNMKLFRLAESLSKNDIVVSVFRSEWAHFGSWVLEFQKGADADTYSDALLNKKYDTWGPIVLRVTWDGREEFLDIEEAKTPPLSGPNEWKKLLTKKIKKRKKEGLYSFIETYVNNWVNENA